MVKNKFLFLSVVSIFFVIVSMSNVMSLFCTYNGYIYNSTGTRTIADIGNVVCVNYTGLGYNTTYTPLGLPNDGYGGTIGTVQTNGCNYYCPNGLYFNFTNSTLNIFGEEFNASCGSLSSSELCVTHVYMAAEVTPGPTITIVTPTSDYTYTSGTTNYDAICTAGSGSISEVIFTSNYTGVETNYSYTGAQVSNPSGDTYRFTMPSLSASTYLVYSWFCNQTDSQSDTDGPQGITINQDTGSVYTYLNNSRSNITFVSGTSIWLNATLQNGIGDIKLYNNDTLINQGSSPLSNYTLFSSEGLFNITSTYDGNENYTSAYETWWVNVTSPDSEPPTFTSIPSDPSINYLDSLGVDFDASDPNLDSFSVNDSRFIINSTGFLENNSILGAGVYVLNVSVNDTYGNENSTLLVVTINQISPSLNIILSPSSSESYGIETTATGTGCTSQLTCTLYRNDTGVVSSPDVDILGVGSYNYTYNTTGNQNYTSDSYSVVLTITQSISNCDVLFSQSSPIIYGNSFNVYTNCDIPFTLYRNGTSITNNSIQSLGAGTWNFTVVRTDQENYSNVYDEQLFTISKASGSVYTYLNNSRSNITFESGTSIWLNATLQNGVGNIYLYNNSNLINQGSSPLSNYTTFNSEGLYNITSTYDGNENYTSAIETFWVNVTAIADTTAPSFTDIVNLTYYDNESVYYDINATDASPLDCFSVNDTTNFQIDCQGILQNATALSVGIYPLNITVNDTYGNMNWTEIYVNITSYPIVEYINVTLYGIYEPLCCAGGTGDWCIENSQYNETTGVGDVYCEGDNAGSDILVNVQHVMEFDFKNITTFSSDIIECVLEQSDGSLLYVNETGLTLTDENYTLQYAVSNDTIITRDESNSIHDLPWGHINCSIKNSTGDILESTIYNGIAFVHRNLQWNVFDYQKAVFAESVPYKFFNNTIALKKPYIDTDYKSYVRALAFKHYAGSQTEEFCFDSLDNDADTQVDEDDNDCRTFTHRYDVSEMNFTQPYFTGGIFAFIRGITGNVILSDTDNIVIDALGTTNYWYTVNTDLDGSFKIRIYETSPGSSGYGYTIKNFTNVSSAELIGTLPSGYSSSYACGASAGLDEGYCNINFDCSSCGNELVDFVYIINSSNPDFDSSTLLELEVVHGTTIETESFTAYFDPADGLNNTLENESSSATDSNLCDDNINNDLDISTDYTYISGLNTINKISWSRDCADPDCDSINGPSYTPEQDISFSQSNCEYLTELSCSDGYDNDFNDNYSIDAYGMQNIFYTDCHDVDCFRDGSSCPTSETTCNDGINNDWDYVDTDSESTSGHKIGNTDNSGGTTWNNLKYLHTSRLYNLTDCEDPDCDGNVGGTSGEICEWAHEENCSDGFNNDALQTYDCQISGSYGLSNGQAPAYGHVEYDCSIYCRANVDSIENGTQCDDGIDNDFDYWDNSSIFSGVASDGIDCGWNGTGLVYNPDSDCHLETMGNGYRCELGVELTCNDSFSNDYDGTYTTNGGWNSTLYDEYFSQFGMTYIENADCDDYDCQGINNCPTTENLGSDAWCFDGADNDLDGLIDCSDSDCAGVSNPADSTEVCYEYEFNSTRLTDDNPNTTSLQFCGNNLDDENKNDDNNLSLTFNYNSIGFTYTGSRTEKMDCNDADCRQEFGQCAPCSSNEFVEWDSCFDTLDNDHDSSSDSSDSDCDGKMVDERGYNSTNGPSIESDCNNGYDDDGDSDIDCYDSDCTGELLSSDGRLCGSIESGTELTCNDDFDNDNDGNIDCYDSDCYSSCGLDSISGSGITHSPSNSSFSLTGDVTISGTSTSIARKGGDLYVSYSYSGGSLGGITIVLGSYATGEIINTTAFNVANAEFVSNPNGFSMDTTYANDGYLTFTSSSLASFSFTVRIPGNNVVLNPTNIKSTAEIGTNTASGSFSSQVVNDVAPSIAELKIEPSNGKLSSGDKLEVIAGNFTGTSGGQTNSGEEGRCRIQVTGPNGFSIDEYKNDCKGSAGSSWKVYTSGTYTVNITPYDNTGNQGTVLSDSLTITDVSPVISLGLSRASSKRVHFASSNSNYNSLDDEFNLITGTMLASFTTDTNYPFTSNSCNVIIYNSSGSVVSTSSISETLVDSGKTINCVADADLSSLISDGYYVAVVNVTDGKGYSLDTSSLVFFNCNDISSYGDSWDCRVADFDVDGYTEGINLSFNYSIDGLTFYQLPCDSCPEDSNLGKDSDGDGYDNACDPICGDGLIEGSETCDDGNTVNGDGCSSTCIIEVTEEPSDGGADGDGTVGGAVSGGAGATLEFEPDPFEVTIRQGQDKIIELKITNLLSSNRTLTIDYSDFEKFMLIEKSNFTLGPLESVIIPVEVFAGINEEPEVYAGTIKINGERLDTVIQIKEKGSLFDIITRVITKTVSPGNEVKASITMVDIGDLGTVDVRLYYAIKSFNNTIIADEEETVTVNGNLTIERSLFLPEWANETNYLFYSKIYYEDYTATSSDTFSTSSLGGVVLVVIVIITVTSTATVIVILYRRSLIETSEIIRYGAGGLQS